ncbi:MULTISPECIES: hypothetical protein [unclassified Ruegeria]|uniref:hypothetical protein n=1 Tax=unclassified Ruegeria TaxID=2625375 RepID=UPI001488E445|nr:MULTISPECIES: hypothetical protein [unclassified Ruegeria]
MKHVKDEHAGMKLEFRQSLLNKMNFLNPKMVLMMNTQSDVFFGYDRQAEYFVCGQFYDSLLGDLLDLEQNLSNSDFELDARNFFERMHKISDYDIKELVSKFNYRGAMRADGYCISTYYPPAEIRILKNDNVIARSGPFSPKHKGYFKETLYQNVVEDIGGTGVSAIEVSFGIWNGGEIEFVKTFYVYVDHPRAKVGTDIEYYAKVCSLFTPLLDEIEQDMLSKDINSAGFLDCLSEGIDEDVDDTLLGLPANPYSRRTFTL